MRELLHTSLVVQEYFVGDGWPSQTTYALGSEAQAIFCLRRHQPRRPPLANQERPGPAAATAKTLDQLTCLTANSADDRAAKRHRLGPGECARPRRVCSRLPPPAPA